MSHAALRRVLFLYNVPDWAIHNVGRDWAGLLQATHRTRLERFGAHEAERVEEWDHVVWGYSTLGYSGRILLKSALQRPLGLLRWGQARSGPLKAVVQDPSELFPEVPDWLSHAPRLGHLERFRSLAVTSNEMLGVLRSLGLDAVKVNTRSLLPLRDAATLRAEPLRVFTRAAPYPRKNLALVHALAERHRGSVDRFDPVLGAGVQSSEAYIRMIDHYNCYICTSWQEGGPLPLRDAQRRGCVVLTTRVGQTDEWVEDGVNGWFCDTESAFSDRIEELRRDPGRLLAMRRAALERAGADDAALVRRQLQEFLP